MFIACHQFRIGDLTERSIFDKKMLAAGATLHISTNTGFRLALIIIYPGFS